MALRRMCVHGQREDKQEVIFIYCGLAAIYYQRDKETKEIIDESPEQVFVHGMR